jgi:two-component system alkaline phosphatase synthesis response regulator PhoP
MSRNASEKILIVEDEQHLADGLRFNLEAEGFQVRSVDTGEAALELLLPAPGNGAPAAAKHAFDVVVLDVMLPGPEDVLEGFAAGADDYLPKPFELAILMARIRGLLRRREWLRASASPPEPKDSFVFGDKSIHFDLLELRVRGQVYPLTVMEASVLRYLVEHEDKAVSRKAMLQDVWGLHEDTDTRAIDNFIVRLRRYLEDDTARPRHLLTVRGVGYRFIAFPRA